MTSIIWDLDGTLIDSYDIITQNIYLSYIDFIKLDKNVIRRQVIKTSVTEYFIEVAKQHNLPLDLLYKNYKAYTALSKPRDYRLIEDVKKTLQALTDRGYKHYIYTHRGKSTHDILQANGIDHFFVEVVTSDNGYKRKPDAQALDYLINKYHMTQTATYYVGDRQLDVACGMNAGINTIYFNQEGHKHDQATFSIKHYLQILPLLHV